MFKKKIEIQEVIIEGKKVYHVAVRPPMEDEEYDNIKYHFESIGGYWREKFGGFIFMENPAKKLLDIDWEKPIKVDEYTKWKRFRQFFPTPPALATVMCNLAHITKETTVLEPSAGHGNLLSPIKEAQKIIAVEIDEKNVDILRKQGYYVIHDMFENVVDSIENVDRVIMNPPFSGQRDLKHTMLAFDKLKEGGILVGIISENNLFYKTEANKKFHEFLRQHKHEFIGVPMRSFPDTNVDVRILKIEK